MRVNLICDAGRRYNSTYGTSCPMYPSSSLDLSTPDQEEEEEEEEEESINLVSRDGSTEEYVEVERRSSIFETTSPYPDQLYRRSQYLLLRL